MGSEVTELAHAAYAALNGGDLDAFLAGVDPDVEFTSLIAESEGRTYHGHDGVREWWGDVARALGGLHFEQDKVVDLGDRGYTSVVVTGQVSGVEVPQRMWQAVKVRDGKAYWWRTCRSEDEAKDLLGIER